MSGVKSDALSLAAGAGGLVAAGVTGAGVIALFPAIAGLLGHFENRNTAALVAARDEMLWEWVITEKNATLEHVAFTAQLAKDLDIFNARLGELATDPEFARVRDNYGFEASREAVAERRRMLAFASAGSVNVDVQIAQLARVERTIRELDPSDVRLFFELADTGSAAEDSAARFRGLRAAGISGEVLIASGCIAVDGSDSPYPGGAVVLEKAGPYADITTLGRLVLVVLDPYKRACAAEETKVHSV